MHYFISKSNQPTLLILPKIEYNQTFVIKRVKSQKAKYLWKKL